MAYKVSSTCACAHTHAHMHVHMHVCTCMSTHTAQHVDVQRPKDAGADGEQVVHVVHVLDAIDIAGTPGLTGSKELEGWKQRADWVLRLALKMLHGWCNCSN